MAQLQLQRGRPNYVFSFDAQKAFDTAPHGALHFILCHLSAPPEVIDLLLFVHTCARLRIVTAPGLTQPVHMLRGVWQGNPESPLLYALLLEPLLRAQGHRLRPPGEAQRQFDIFCKREQVAYNSSRVPCEKAMRFGISVKSW